MNENKILVNPFIDMSKEQLLKLLEKYQIEYITNTEIKINGKWIKGDYEEWWQPIYTCSICDKDSIGGKFCLHCGTEMEEEIDDE